MWLKISRGTYGLFGYWSWDGITWIEAGRLFSTSPLTMYAGLAVTSHDDGQICAGYFSDIQWTGASPPGASQPTQPTNVQAIATSYNQVELSWVHTSPPDTWYAIDRSFDNVNYGSVASTRTGVTRYLDQGLQPSTTYYYRLRAMNSLGIAPATDPVWATTFAAPPPSPWEFGNVGSPTLPGSHTTSGNTITLKASGEDIWSNNDGFYFVWKRVAGDVTVEAMISSISARHEWAKAGVMIRASLNPATSNVFALVTPGGVVGAQTRPDTFVQTQLTVGSWNTAPYWVRLVRQGYHVTAYSSPNGADWTQIAAYDVSLPEEAYVGFAFTSHEQGYLGTAVFTDPAVR